MPIARFQMPDGRIGRFEVPDGTTPEQATQLISQSLAPQQKQSEPTGYNLHSGAETLRNVTKNEPGYEYGSILPFKKNIKTGERSLAVPEAIKSPIRGIADLINASENKSIEMTPDAVSTVMAIAPLAQLRFGGPEAVASPGIFSKLMSDETSGKSVRSVQQKRLNYAMDLARPKETPSVIRDTALQRSSGGGIMNKQVYTPTQREIDIADTISGIGVKKSNPLVDNLQIINNAKNAEAIKLQSMVEKSNVKISPNDVSRMGQQIASRLEENPLVTADSETVSKILRLAQSTLDKNPKTAAGLLQARKDFDFAIKQFQPSGLDSSSPATAFRYAAKVVRQSLNDTVGELVPSAEVKQSLMRQNHMYEAIDNIATKIPSQGTNRFSRFLQTPPGKAAKYGGGALAAGATGNYVVDKMRKQ